MAVKMTSVLFVIMVCVAAVGRCHGEDAAERAEAWAQGAGQKASDAFNDVKDNADSDSWTGWAINKLSEGIGFVDSDKAKNAAQNVVDKTSDAASKSTDTLNSAAYETSRYASEKANDMVGSSVGMASATKERTNNAYESASEEVGHARSLAGEMTAEDLANFARQKAQEAYDSTSGASRASIDDARKKATDAYEKSDNAVKQKAAEAVKAAKQKGGEADRLAKEKGGDAQRLMNQAKDKVKEKGGDAQKLMKEAKDKANEKGGEAEKMMKQAKDKANESYGKAKASMSERDRQKLEEARQKASQAAGDMGKKA
ncbi:hypothetical protein C2S52_023642 [Perilla frutescens var. hirtella]|nr:hypothetical protein C2S52_023642 [Perilla frutescens var. hirtella]